MTKFQVCGCIFLGLLLLVSSSPILAQTTIFNVPSTDVLSEKLFYVEADFTAHLDKFSKGSFQTFGYKTVYGVRKNLEVGANFFYTRNGVTAPKEFQANVKWRAYNNEKYGVAATTGAIVFVPLNKSAGTRTSAMLYTNASKIIKGAKGMRLTGGIYTMFGAKREFGTKTGAIVGFEQPVRRRLSFIADWYSGKNRFGYTAAGLSYAVTKKQFLYTGYNFGNAGRANNSLSIFYGYTF